jgi:hypothetical protein
MIKINVFYIFEMIVGTIQLAKELVNKELHMFWRYQVNAKDITCPLQRLGKHEFGNVRSGLERFVFGGKKNGPK